MVFELDLMTVVVVTTVMISCPSVVVVEVVVVVVTVGKNPVSAHRTTPNLTLLRPCDEKNAPLAHPVHIKAAKAVSHVSFTMKIDE